MKMIMVVSKEEMESFTDMCRTFAAITGQEMSDIEELKGKASKAASKYATMLTEMDEGGRAYNEIEVDPEVIRQINKQFEINAPLLMSLNEALSGALRCLKGLKGMFKAQFNILKQAFTLKPVQEKEEAEERISA